MPDGLSCATRVMAASVPAEYSWLRRYHPGAKVEMQALTKCGAVPVDILYVKTPNGAPLAFYFDISSFF